LDLPVAFTKKISVARHAITILYRETDKSTRRFPMAKTKGTTFNLDSALVGRRFANTAGFNAAAGGLGKDSQPGPNPGSPGAPLMQNRVVDDFAVKATRYPTGIYPFGLNHAPSADPATPTMERPLDGRAPTIDAPVPISGRQLPHPDLMTKADEARFAEALIGSEPRGVLIK
jgi:hypothetical protein